MALLEFPDTNDAYTQLLSVPDFDKLFLAFVR